jgi:hypothetical protein
MPEHHAGITAMVLGRYDGSREFQLLVEVAAEVEKGEPLSTPQNWQTWEKLRTCV